MTSKLLGKMIYELEHFDKPNLTNSSYEEMLYLFCESFLSGKAIMRIISPGGTANKIICIISLLGPATGFLKVLEEV